jgi:hypothetical protein
LSLNESLARPTRSITLDDQFLQLAQVVGIGGEQDRLGRRAADDDIAAVVGLGQQQRTRLAECDPVERRLSVQCDHLASCGMYFSGMNRSARSISMVFSYSPASSH